MLPRLGLLQSGNKIENNLFALEKYTCLMISLISITIYIHIKDQLFLYFCSVISFHTWFLLPQLAANICKHSNSEGVKVELMMNTFIKVAAERWEKFKVLMSPCRVMTHTVESVN